MKTRLPLLCLTLLAGCSTPPDLHITVAAARDGRGQSCDSAGFLEAAAKAERLRVKRRLTAEAFARMAREPNTIVLDARSTSDFRNLRIKGSVNLPYTAMAEESLRRIIPDLKTRILIYCRNNIDDTRPPDAARTGGLRYPDEFDPPHVPKRYNAGLNIPTYITLYIYGYHNVWELDPAVDPNHSPIEFEGDPIGR